MKKESKIRCPLFGGAINLKEKLIPLMMFVVSGAMILTGLGVTSETAETKKAEVITKIKKESIISKEEETKKALEEKKFVVETEKRTIKSYKEIASEIIQGKYGNGEQREKALINLGYDEESRKEIQNIVDIKISQSKVNSSKTTEVKNVKNNKTATVNKKKTIERVPITKVASIVWNCMKKYGWNDIVCAGIMGNLMAEVGGQTLNLNYNSSGGCGYGLCQWTSGRRNLLLSMYGSAPTIEEQVEYIYKELTGKGVRRQVSEQVYQSLLNASSPEECALIFAHKFERCGAAFVARQKNARKAYNTFAS